MTPFPQCCNEQLVSMCSLWLLRTWSDRALQFLDSIFVVNPLWTCWWMVHRNEGCRALYPLACLHVGPYLLNRSLLHCLNILYSLKHAGALLCMSAWAKSRDRIQAGYRLKPHHWKGYTVKRWILHVTLLSVYACRSSCGWEQMQGSRKRKKPLIWLLSTWRRSARSIHVTRKSQSHM